MNSISTASAKRTLLNPNAREFFPTSLRSSSSAFAITEDDTEPSTASDNGKTFSDKTVSSDTCTSDEESRRYWNAQLPDDIFTPDTDLFISAVEESIVEPGTQASASESFGLTESVDYVADNHRWERTLSKGKQILGPTHVADYELPTSGSIPRQLWEEEQSLSSFLLSPTSANWNGPLSGSRTGSSHSFALGQAALKEINVMDALSVLSDEFPNIPVECLANVYQANGGDLSTITRVLNQMKLQDEATLWHNVLHPSRLHPNSRPTDFPSFSTPEHASRLSHLLDDVDLQDPEFPRLARKSNYRYGPAEFSHRPSSFSSLNSHPNLFDGELHEDRLDLSHLHHKQRLSPRNWVDTDEALVNLLSELKEEARNHGRIRNLYFEQARQAFIVGNRLLTKEASLKGQSHNGLMKAAQNKAAEIELQRSLSNAQASSFGSGQTPELDLRGLHVNEAIHLLKRDLSALRLAARSSRQYQQVLIRVGTGHQKGARTPARLLFAVKQYLVEEELLNVAEAQPGILKVVVS